MASAWPAPPFRARVPRVERVLVRAGGAAGRALALAALATLAACSDPAPPAWISLAGRFTLENEQSIAEASRVVPMSQEQIDEQVQKLEDATS